MRALAFFVTFFALAYGGDLHFRTIREWNYLNFTWLSDQMFAKYVYSGWYVPENNIIAGTAIYGGYIYLSLPKMHDGVPVTLTRIKEDDGDMSPLLEPYPSWEMNQMGNCGAVQNVQNLEVDALGRLWIIDGGRPSTMAMFPVIKCAPKLILHDLTTNTTKLTYEFPPEVANRETSYLYDLVVDQSDGYYVYITDNSKSDPGLVVYSLQNNKSWKIRHNPSMMAQTNAINFTVAHVPITPPINIAGIALGPNNRVYYSAMSSYHIYSIHTDYLKTPINSKGEFKGPVLDLGNKSSQSDGMIADDQGDIYFGLLNSSAIARWNINEPNVTEEVCDQNLEIIQWPNAFSFNDKGNLIVLTNRLHKFVTGQLDLNEVNYRLISAHVGSRSYIYAQNKPEATVPINLTSTSSATTTVAFNLALFTVSTLLVL